MKFWIILLCLFGMVGYAWSHYFGSDSKFKTTEEQTENHEPSSNKPFSQRRNLPVQSIASRPVASITLFFKNRPVPSDDLIRGLVGFNSSKPKTGKDEPERVSVRYAIDKESNSVSLIGDMEEMHRVAELIQALDRSSHSAHLKTWVVWVKGDKQTSFDVVARIVADGKSVALASLGGGVFKSALQIEKLQLAIEASDHEGKLEIVDQPYMPLMQAVPSIITTGEEVAIPSTTANQGVTETSIEFKTVGLSLSVTPWFLDHERVRLAVSQENGIIGNTRIIDGVQIPEIYKQTLDTTVEMQIGETAVLGGVETAQRVKLKGWLTRKDERQVGHLYVVASIYSTIPKAVPVSDLEPDFPLQPGLPSSDGDQFLDGNHVLPTWNRKEEIKIEPKTSK